MFVNPTNFRINRFPIFKVILLAISQVQTDMDTYIQTWSCVDIGPTDYNLNVH